MGHTRPPGRTQRRKIPGRAQTRRALIPRCYSAMPEYNCLCARRALFKMTLGNRTALPPDTPPSVQVSRSLRAPGVYKPGAHTFAKRLLATNRLPPPSAFHDFAASPIALFRTACNCGALRRSFDQATSRPVKWRIGIFFTAIAGCLTSAMSRLRPGDAVHTDTPVARPKLSGVDRTGATQ
jgi:hypothetical protein